MWANCRVFPIAVNLQFKPDTHNQQAWGAWPKEFWLYLVLPWQVAYSARKRVFTHAENNLFWGKYYSHMLFTSHEGKKCLKSDSCTQPICMQPICIGMASRENLKTVPGPTGGGAIHGWKKQARTIKGNAFVSTIYTIGNCRATRENYYWHGVTVLTGQLWFTSRLHTVHYNIQTRQAVKGHSLGLVQAPSCHRMHPKIGLHTPCS